MRRSPWRFDGLRACTAALAGSLLFVAGLHAQTARAACAEFSLISPANGSSVPASTSIDLVWGGSLDATSYDLFFGTQANPPLRANTSNTGITLNGVTPGMTYNWYVVAKGACGTRTSAPSLSSFSIRPLPTATVSGTATVCAGGTALLSAALTGTAPWTLLWSDGFTQSNVTSSPATRNVAPAGNTTYTVTSVTDAGGSAAGTGSAVITVKQRPTAAALGGSIICAGASASLTGSGGVSCSWTPATGLSNASSCAPEASPNVTTRYSLTVTDADGCVSTNTAQALVTVSPTPAKPSISAPPSATPGQTGLTASVIQHGNAYTWSILNGTITGGQGTNAITFTAGPNAGTLTLRVIETTGTGCASPQATITVVVAANAGLGASIAADPLSGTLPFSTAYTSRVSGGTPPYTYAWSTGETVANPTHAWTAPGTFQVSLTVKDSSQPQKTATSNTIPIVANPAGGACSLTCSAAAPPAGAPGVPIDFAGSATTTSCAAPPTYAWTFGDGGTSTEQNPKHAYANPGTFTWNLTVSVAGGPSCTKLGSITVSSDPCASVGAAALTAPLAGAIDQSTSQTFRWGPGAGATRYDLYLDVQNPPAAIAVSDLTTTTYSVGNLLAGKTYFWRVVSKGSASCSPVPTALSEIRSFTTAATCGSPGAFDVTSPADHATVAAGALALAWQAAAGASTYDLYLGATNPPPLRFAGLAAPSANVADLVAGTVYFWNVVAHSACDESKTTPSPLRTFTVTGGCTAPGSLSTTSPASGSTSPSADVTLKWSASASAASYDLYLGTSQDPPLHTAGLPGTQTSVDVTGLTPGVTYRWKVIARAACNPALTASTAVATFGVACNPPGVTSFVFVPPGNVGVGQTYVLSWAPAPGLDAGGGYQVERSLGGTVLDTQTTTSTSASFTAAATGGVSHRVRAVSACGGAAGLFSSPATVTIVDGGPNVIFSVPPQAVIAALGERIEDLKTTFTLENISQSPVQLLLGSSFAGRTPFFSILDPTGGSTGLLTLAPKQPKTFEVRFAGIPNSASASYEGIVFAAATGLGQSLVITPYAFVNLKVGGSPSPAPEFLVGGKTSEYAFFPGFASTGSDAQRPPITIGIRNTGASPMELGAEIAPEVWLTPEPGWNAPIAPGATRNVKLFTNRSLAPNGSALPRYTYFNVRTRSGQTARLLVQDNDATAIATGRTSALQPGERSYVVPSIVSSATFVTKLRLSNAGTATVQADLYFTSHDEDGFTGTVKRATLVVPPNDVVSLVDPLAQLFGTTGTAFGSLEVRASQDKIGFLTVTSSVDAPAATGGTFGFQMPTALRGEGARLGNPHLITGITSTAAFRTNLLLTETTGVDSAVVTVELYDLDANLIGSREVTVPRYGLTQITRVVEVLGGGTNLSSGRLEITVKSGGGSVIGIVTVIDNANADAVTYVGRPTGGASAGAAREGLGGPLASAIVGRFVVPAVVNGFPTFRNSDKPFTFRSLMGFTSGGAQAAVFNLEYHDLQTGQTLTKSVTVQGRKTKEYANVLEELFGITSGARSQGPIFVEVTGNGVMYCKVYSNLDKGTLGDAFPVIPVPYESLTTRADKKPLALDGLEQSIDLTRGTRSNLILNEVSGKSATVTVRLYEAGNRTSPIAEKDYALGAFEKVQLSTVFESLGLGQPAGSAEPRLKDRTNVEVVVTAKGGDGLVSAVVTTIDNKTGDTKNSLLAPNGGVAATGPPIGF